MPDKENPVTVVSESSRGAFLSVVVPVLNEEDTIEPFWSRMRAILANLEVAWEIIFVDDGSTDRTIPVILQVFAGQTNVRIVKLSRNFGKEEALTAGLTYAAGQVACIIDIDLQDPPELLPEMIERWRAGDDVVVGVRSSRASDTRFKKASATAFYAVYNRMSDVPLPANMSDFCLIDRRIMEFVVALPERSRFTKGLLWWPGFSRTVIQYPRASRIEGDSKYSYLKLWNYAIDGLTSFSSVPLRMWTYVGLLIGVVGIMYAVYLVVRTSIFGVDVPGYASIMIAVLILGGIQLVSLGMFGEYLGRMFVELKGRPIFLVDKVIELSSRPDDTTGRQTW
ncbi:MAG: glycosyltransferase family 2 protein [Hyphomicrobiales bacterium]|nr:glycosyltransferase family 2 protein [Hyphomicrobiales bacterium]